MNTEASLVLIVDDDPDIRDALSVALVADGYLIKATASLLGATTIMEQEPTLDYMLLDYNLPGMPLQDFLARAETLHPRMAVVLISAIDNLAEKAARYKVKQYLPKPFDFERLRQMLKKVTAASEKK